MKKALNLEKTASNVDVLSAIEKKYYLGVRDKDEAYSEKRQLISGGNAQSEAKQEHANLGKTDMKLAKNEVKVNVPKGKTAPVMLSTPIKEEKMGNDFKVEPVKDKIEAPVPVTLKSEPDVKKALPKVQKTQVKLESKLQPKVKNDLPQVNKTQEKLQGKTAKHKANVKPQKRTVNNVKSKKRAKNKNNLRSNK